MSWSEVKKSAYTTIGKAGKGEPSDSWKRAILKAEHSPIRTLWFKIVLDIPSFVSTHLVRHKIGVEHFVTSQREDRTGVERGGPDSIVRHVLHVNAQGLINISRKRLCRLSHVETRRAWIKALDQVDDTVKSACVPECIYRGFCPEMKSCGWSDTPVFNERLWEYRRGTI